MNPYSVGSFEDFWPHYVRMHSRRATRRMHAVATLSAIVLVALAVILRQPLLLLAAPIADYAIAQLSHRLFERNVTQPWRHPAWHFRAEMRMFYRTVTGQKILQIES
jgi:hypothetical protein